MTRTEAVYIDGTRHEVKHAGSEHALHSYAAERLARIVALDLEMSPLPVIKWYRIDPPDPTARRALRGFVHSDERGVIYIRADQDERETLVSVAHELWHRLEFRDGMPLNEAVAEAYGQKWADRYLALRRSP